MDEEIKNLLQQNLELNKEIHEIVKKTATYIKWLRVMDILKLVLILLPLIAAWLFLPPLLQNLSSAYQDVLPTDLLK